MLKAEKRQIETEPEDSNYKARLESYSNLLFEMVTKLGYVLPDVKYEDDPLRRKYQPALGFEKCLTDINQFMNTTIFHENVDILDFLRCRIGEWKLLTNQLLPLLVFLVNQSPNGSEPIINLLLILNRILTDRENDEDSQKSAYHKDLMHYMAIYKKLFSHIMVMSALTTLLASTISGQASMKTKCSVVAQILELLDTLIVAPEPVAEKGNLNLNLAYGRKETVLMAMTRSKIINVIFGISSSFEDDDEGLPYRQSTDSGIPAKAWGIVAAIFRDVNVMDVIDPKISIKNDVESEQKSSRKPIRHGRFSGSVSVVLTTGQKMLIKNSALFTSGIPGSLDVVTRKNKKLEDQLSALQSQRKALLAEEKKMYLKLSKEYLESHFNALFLFVRKRWDASPSLPPRDTIHYMEIAGYFLEFCRIHAHSAAETPDMYPLIFGIIHKPLIFSMIEFLHVTIIEKHYPALLKLLKFYRELLFVIEIFSTSAEEDRKYISKMLQKELFHSKTMLMVIKRVVDNSKPVLKFFSSMILDCNHVLLRLVEAYGQEHPYWNVTTASHVFNQLASNDEEDHSIRVLGAESNFSYQSLVRHYSSRDMVDFYIHLLANCQFESSDTNNKVGKYLERVVRCPDFCKFLLRPTLVVQLQKVLSASSSWTARNSDLVYAAKSIVRKYCEFIKSDPNNLKLSFFT